MEPLAGAPSIFWLESTDSTNYALRARRSELDNLSIVAAREQTEGRGQGTHTWFATPGRNLTFSIFYRFGEAVGRVPGIRVKVADTNGAGDTFLGALLSRLVLRGEAPLQGLTAPELEDMLRFANRAAALTCTRSGAIPAMPTLAEVEAFCN